MQFMLQTASFGIYSVNFDILMYTVAVVVYWKQSVVLISPNMKEPYVREEYRWIPWEIKYSIQAKECISRMLTIVPLPMEHYLTVQTIEIDGESSM